MSPVVPAPVEEPVPTLDMRTGVVSFDRGDKVPAWTPEDAANFAGRIQRLAREEAQVAPIRDAIMAHIKPPTVVTFAVDLVIDRAGRHRCPECRLRRELFAIAVTGHAFGASEPRCARCWGFR